MGKNDFDIDFDFEKEYGFDPKAFLGAEEYDDNINLSEFSDEELGLAAKKAPAAEDNDDFYADEQLDMEDKVCAHLAQQGGEEAARRLAELTARRAVLVELLEKAEH